MNLSLFSTKPDASGYRLDRFEVFNWGTFDHQIWRMEPSCETSLLTGANASGKTTLVDALLTLLVPEKRMRFYNQTAGSKGERTEESYVLGEYGETENAEYQVKEIQKLRKDRNEAVSILLAVFKNESVYTTLAQVRWFAGDGLKRSFVVASKALSIQEDFMPVDGGGEWRKRLKQKYPKSGNHDTIHMSDSPGDYARLMRKRFGMRSEKAHALFSKTVGLKVLGNLDEFVRSQMLEYRDSEAEFQNVKSHLSSLSDAHQAIEKANKQVELLKPVEEIARRLDENTEAKKHTEDIKTITPFWYAIEHKRLIYEDENRTQDQLSRVVTTRDIKERRREELDQEERNIDQQIKSDKVGNRISQIKSTIQRLRSDKKDKEGQLKRYNEVAVSLDLSENPSSEALFLEQRDSVQAQRKAVESTIEELSKQLNNVQIELYKAKAEFEELSSEITQLRDQKNNITGNTARIRGEILSYCGANEQEIPFIGELIKVKEDELSWEPAIEKLLRSFALRLLVPDKYYASVTEYVHTNNLRGRIQYYHVKDGIESLTDFKIPEPDELYRKLEFKRSAFRNWIEDHIKRHFDFLCIDDLKIFQLSDKAITRSGLIRTRNRHEKDDRAETQNRQYYVLGWDNKEKIHVLREQAAELKSQINTLQQKQSAFEAQQKRNRKRLESLAKFEEYTQYSTIDIWGIATEIEKLKLEVEELESTNDKIRELKRQQDTMLAEIKDLNSEIRDLDAEEFRFKARLGQHAQKKAELDELISSLEQASNEIHVQHLIDEFTPDQPVSLETIESQRTAAVFRINQELEVINENIRKEKNRAQNLMRQFKHPDKEILVRFSDWNVDTHRLGDDAEQIGEYVALLNRIEKEELAGHRERFQKFLNEEMITKMADFKAWLDTQEDDISSSVETLNDSLSRITFKSNPGTFIRLETEKDYSPNVKEFRQRLSSWQPDFGEFSRTEDYAILEESYIKIKSLLDDLTIDETRRKEVLDVRNWLKFKVVEYYKNDPSLVYRSYTGTAKLSGGEGAQLTYTILGSAIAYQFGIHSEGLNPNSFRFICVDEAFSKQDDEKARFLMELCKQLHLQVMVVSPAKAEEVAIVEPYIARIHFVQRKNNRESLVFDMSIKQLQDQKAEYLTTLTSS